MSSTSMVYQAFVPAPPLHRYIERIWLCSDTPSAVSERIVPSGTVELVINLREDEIRIHDPRRPDRCRLSGGVLSGPYHSFFVIDPRQHASILGVHFRPGGAHPFLGMPAHELADTHVDLAAIWGAAAAAELRDRLCAAGSPRERFSLLEAALCSRLRANFESHWAVSAALQLIHGRGGSVRVRDLAREVGLCQRRLIQVFAAEVGLTPKQYGRVQRFQRARALCGRMEDPDWAELAYTCGYADQSHLIHDFQAFAGHSPAAYRRRANPRLLPNHVPPAG